MAAPTATSADASCTDTWTGAAGDGLWQSAENWSSDRVPGAEDVACIGAGGTVHLSDAGNVTGTLLSQGRLVISGGSLELTSAAERSSVASLSIEGGTLTGAGSVDVSGSLMWTGGTLSGSGEMVLGAGATGSIEPGSGAAVALTQRKLVNEGTLTLASGSVEGRSNAEIDNSGTFDVNADAPGSEWFAHGLLNSDGSDVWVHNTGTVKKTEGNQFSQIQFHFDNEGAVEVDSGQLIFSGGTHASNAATGSWHASEGTSIALSGGSFLLGSGVDMSGMVVLAGGNVQVGDIQGPDATLVLWSGGSTLELTDASTPSHVSALEQHSNTTLTGPASLAVSGLLGWTGGTWSGAGETVLGSAATGSIDPGSGGAVSLTQRKLVNEGTLSLVSGSVEGRSAAEIDNSGTFDVNADAPGSEWWEHGLLKSDGSDVWVHNTGTVKKTSGGQFTQVQLEFDNQGTVEVGSGQLIFSGGSHGSNAASGSWHSSEGTSLAFSGGSFLLGSAVEMSGTVFLAGGSVQVGDIQAPESTLQLWSDASTLDLTDAATLSHVGTLEQHTNTTLTGAGTLDVSGSLSWGASSTMSGPGATVLEPGGTGSIEASSGCEPMHLEGRRFVNEGTLAFGWGTMMLSAGAQFQNDGTFKDDSEASCDGPQIQVASGGSAPSIINHGTFEKAAGGGTGTVAVTFGNDGHVEAQTGRLDFSGGGIPEAVATGTWTAAGAGSLGLTGGTFLIAEGADLSAVEVSGATVEREPVAGPPHGSLNELAYASHTVTVSGSGTSVGTGFSAATIEITPSGAAEWKPLCGPLSPSLTGEFSCSWNTASGAYPHGVYQARAQLSDAATPPSTAPTSAILVHVDNTPPEGSIEASTYLGPGATVSGQAHDSGSGVAGWKLQMAPAGSSEWSDACPEQTAPEAGDKFGCAPRLSGHPDGVYGLRATITDRAGNTYVTETAQTTVDSTPPTGSLDAVGEAPYLTGTLSISGTAADTLSGVESWTPQYTPVGTSAWADLCAPVSTPASGSRYGCSIDTRQHPDGTYDYRAVVTDNAGNTFTTASREVTVDNTPPTASLSYLPRTSSGVVSMHGLANDATSGVSSWTLQIAPADENSWNQACLPQTLPTEGSNYGCSIDTTTYPDGAYQLRAIVADSAGHTYTTQAIPARIDNSEASLASCTETWTGAAGGRSWDTAGNWSTGSVPTASDVACIASETNVQVSAGSNAVGWIEDEGDLEVTGGTLEVTDAAVASTVSSLAIHGGTLGGGGEVDVTHSLELNEGAMTGSGRTVLESGATGLVDSFGAVTLDGRQLVNRGVVTWSAGAIVASDGAQILNEATLYANDDGPHCGSGCTGTGIQPGSGTASFENTSSGKVVKQAGSITYFAIPFDNQGSVQAAFGELQFSGGGVAGATAHGSWAAAAGGGLIEFDGGAFALGSEVAMSGEVAVTGGEVSASALQAQEASIAIEAGTLKIEGAASPIESLSVGRGPNGTSSNSTLSGGGEVDVTHSLELNEGAMTGSGRTVLESGATGLVDSFGAVTLDGRQFVNRGALTWSSGAIIAGGGAQIVNEATLYANDDGPHCGWGCTGTGIQPGSGTASFENTSSGKVVKQAGSITYFAIPFDNQGSVQAAFGELQFSGGGVAGATAKGSWEAGSGGALIEFDGGNFALGSEVAMSGAVAVTGGEVSASALQAQQASIAIEAGMLTLEGFASELKSLSVGRGPNGTSWNSILAGGGNVDVADTFEWSEGTIGGTGTLTLGSGSTGTVNPYARAILDGKTLVNLGTLNWYSGSVIGAGGAEILNKGTYELDDQGPTAECWGCHGMYTAGYLRATFGESYFWEGSFTGSATLVNEGTISDPEVSCPSGPNVEVEWPTTSNGAMEDFCTHYTGGLIAEGNGESIDEEEQATDGEDEGNDEESTHVEVELPSEPHADAFVFRPNVAEAGELEPTSGLRLHVYTPAKAHKIFVRPDVGTLKADAGFVPPRLAWKFNIAYDLIAIARGFVTEEATAYTQPRGRKINYHDDHYETPLYGFHSTVTAIGENQEYQLAVNLKFPCEPVPGDGVPEQPCRIYVRHNFILRNH